MLSFYFGLMFGRLWLQRQRQTTVVEESDAYRNFINSIDSEATRRNYRYMFSYFMAFCKETSYDDMVGMEPKRLEGVIRDYIIHLKQDKKRSQGNVSVYISAIRHFYDMNDIDLHWKKIAKFKGRRALGSGRQAIHQTTDKDIVGRRYPTRQVLCIPNVFSWITSRRSSWPAAKRLAKDRQIPVIQNFSL